MRIDPIDPIDDSPEVGRWSKRGHRGHARRHRERRREESLNVKKPDFTRLETREHGTGDLIYSGFILAGPLSAP